jgi:hypothetical protein
MNEVTQKDEPTSDKPKCIFTGRPINNLGSLKDAGRNGKEDVDGVNTLGGPVHKSALAAYSCLLNEIRNALREVAELKAIETIPKGVSDMIPDVFKMCVAEKIHPKEAVQRFRFQIARTMKDTNRHKGPVSEAAWAF